MNKIIVKMTDNFSNLPIGKRPFDIPTTQQEKCSEFTANGKSYTVYQNKNTGVCEYIHETENHRENKGYRIVNPNSSFTLNDIKAYFKEAEI